MTLKAKLYGSAAIAVALLGTGAYIGARMFGPDEQPPIVNVPPEVGRPVEGSDEIRLALAQIRLQIAQLTAEQAAATARKYDGDTRALAQIIASSRQSAGTSERVPASPNSGSAFPKPAPLPSVPEIAAMIESGEVKVLTEKRFGPGPGGDQIDVLAILPCDGCAAELVGQWEPIRPLAHPAWSVERRRFFEVGAVYSTGGPGAMVVAGVDGLRVKRVTLGLRAGALLSADSAAWVGVSGRWDSGGNQEP